MSIPGSTNPLLLFGDPTGGQYQIQRSLRFNSSDSAYLSRTPAVAGNRKTWTWAGWVKRGKLGGENQLFTAGSGNTFTYFSIGDNVADGLTFARYTGSHTFRVSTTQVLRDPSAWYHIFLAVDTSQATDTNRVKLYVNGIQVTVFTTASYPGQNTEYEINNTNDHRIGDRTGNYANSGQFDGYLADIHFIDGQALTPSSFTEVSATTGQLIPKAYTGSFGTNGFWLKFSDNSNNTATTLGKDYSGNSNNWTPNNLSVTAGAGNDSLVDTPTSYGTDTSGVGGVVRGNYCTLNPLDKNAGLSPTNGNLDVVGVSGTTHRMIRATIGLPSGKWYWEITAVSTAGAPTVGIAKQNASLADGQSVGADAFGWGYSYYTGQKQTNGTLSSYGAAWTSGDIIGIAFDADNGTITFYKNGTSQGVAFTGLTSGPYFPAVSVYYPDQLVANFGQRQWAYAAPAGFKALCDTNLPAPLVALPNTVFDAVTYTGSSGSQSITTNFSPDLVWVKTRNAVTSHEIYDIVRGAGVRLSSNDTSAENNLGANGLSSFNSNGFTVPSTANYGINGSGYTYVAWAWDGGTSTASNTQGSITSSLRASPSSGFSVVTYTTTGSAATIGHGLNVAPSLIITKQRNGTTAWYTYHTSIGAGNYLLLNSTAASAAGSSIWNNTAPTSTVFSVGNGFGNGETYVAYCFSPVVGYSSFGSYTGNGSADGPFVYTGFRPKWVMVKLSSGSGSGWQIHRTNRNTYNVMNNRLQPNNSDAESTYTTSDFLSNGFKLRDSDASWNGNGSTYIYIAFAENPLQYARAR